jgi:hypothetical protein
LIQISEDGQSWQCSRREDSKGSSDGGGGGIGDAWEFRSALEAPIARLESLDELEGSQVTSWPQGPPSQHFLFLVTYEWAQ